MRSTWGMVTGLAALVAGPVLSQETFRLDTTFRTEIQRKYVNSLLPTADGKLLASGIMRFPGEFSDKSIVRLLSDGSRDGSFVNSGGGGGGSYHGRTSSTWAMAK